ncbi:uncharacterized protein LOC116350666 [Contarinia nasturtii]|uniref:uncharacterized protein LOC116350666 n=1 Tax=Contarinia nasturtii TaxID=265458 RepID=UPI0012D418FD|nr:uncharacterized protein LOC116350666 [Contarinia nasturtii]
MESRQLLRYLLVRRKPKITPKKVATKTRAVNNVAQLPGIICDENVIDFTEDYMPRDDEFYVAEEEHYYAKLIMYKGHCGLFGFALHRNFTVDRLVYLSNPLKR